MILHIPHASVIIPRRFRDQFVINNEQLASELLGLTDAYTNELFESPGAQVNSFPYSRLLVDVERFQLDNQEPMSKVGMGMIYTQTISGRPLRRSLSKLETATLQKLYDKHHLLLTQSVEDELVQRGTALIVDCHSFPSKPLTCDIDQSKSRPDICLGMDSFHTPGSLLIMLEKAFKSLRLSVEVNKPYSGTIVPLKWYGKEHKVHSVMIEINRSLYMNEITGEKLDCFAALKNELSRILGVIARYS